MARGRKRKNSKGSVNSIAVALDAETHVGNADDDPATKDDLAASTPSSQPDEIWDLIRVIPKTESVVCRVEGCGKAAVATWVTNLDPEDKWDMCEPCQEKDFGGWPEGVEPLSDDEASMAPNNKTTKEDDSGSKVEIENSPCLPEEDAAPLDKPVSPNQADTNKIEDDMKEDGSDEIWDLKRVLSIDEIGKESPIKCSTEVCSLPACCVWVSNKSPKTNWYTCLDCQLKDFGGWPPLEELPFKAMAVEHGNVIGSKCSRLKSPIMPKFPDQTANLTPLPNSLCDSSEQALLGSHVTPSPAIVVPLKPSAATLAAHKKWQDEAEVLNGPGARLVVSNPDAKKLIFEKLLDAFRPMMMADIHKALRALVPTPVLRSCLQDMALDKADAKDQFVESDDDDDDDGGLNKTIAKIGLKSRGDPYAGSLAFKAGKGANTVLYYVDHTKLENRGDGLDRDQRDELVSKLAKEEAEHVALKVKLQELSAQTATLLAEPTNEQLITQLEAEDPVVASLREKLESARQLKVNEKHRKQTQKRIDNMAAHWRKLKRLCMDFLITMEESTEGAITAKKCISGNGPIDIDSDEAIVVGALAFRKKKNARKIGGQPARKKAKLKSSVGNNSAIKEDSFGVGADDSFVAVKLDAHGNVSRVYHDE